LKNILKRILILTLLIYSAITFFNCSTSKVKVKSGNAQKWTYFRIYADADDDPIFVKLQDDLNIDPKMERYTIVVNIKKDNPEPYIIFGDIEESSPKKFPWSSLSKNVQDGLINWIHDNKEQLD
jgi:hypothetical protein